MMNLVQKTVILASVILSTASGFFADEGADPEVVDIPAMINFPSLDSASEEIIIACFPLIDAPPAACDALLMEADMMALLNTCTSAGISNANTRRRASGIDILPQLADTVIVPTPTLNEAAGESAARNDLRGDRRLGIQLQCTTHNPSYLTILLCCMLRDKPSFCGSPGGHGGDGYRRELEEPEDAALTADQVKAYLGFITDECTAQYRALAGTTYTEPCFAEAGNEGALQCTAVMLTG